MEGSVLGGGSLFSPMSSSVIGLEVPIQQNPQSSQPQQHAHLFPHPQLGSYSFGGAASSKPRHGAVSDDDEPCGFNAVDDGEGKRKVSPWQRMKWTDAMVKLLIMAVFYIGDEGGAGEGTDPAAGGKKKPASGGGGLLQKKGKWKSVSRAMMEKGFYVSPQQCEDKFNDLNKRYKRVNDILGKGTACRVVESQGLLESMDLAPKTKEEVKKLLNSKHLFFREMCAYHNSCGHGGIEPTPQDHPLHPEVHAHQAATQQKQCSHSTENETAQAGSEDDEDNNDNEDDNSEDSESDGLDEDERACLRKRAKRTTSVSSETVERFGGELVGVVGDGGRTWREKRDWLRTRAVELEEEGVRCRAEALELEKRRLKWAKFSGKKERELEKARIENERRRLENERMVLMVRQREIEVLSHSNKRSACSGGGGGGGADPSSITG